MSSENVSISECNDQELFRFLREELYSAVISDVLDELGYRNQAMTPEIRPLSKEYLVAGRAKTVLWVDVYEVGPDPYANEIEAVDSIKPGEVVVTCTNQSSHNAPWGELMSTAAQARGAVGAVIDGLIRDSLRIMKMDFPVFCTGLRPIDSKGRGIVVAQDVSVKVGGVTVQPGDIIFADNDGVVVVPRECEAEVFENAYDKVHRENLSLKELRKGELLKDVYERYGVL